MVGQQRTGILAAQVPLSAPVSRLHQKMSLASPDPPLPRMHLCLAAAAQSTGAADLPAQPLAPGLGQRPLLRERVLMTA